MHECKIHTRKCRVGHQDVTRGGQRGSGVRFVGHAQRVAAGRHRDGVRLIVCSTDDVWFNLIRGHLKAGVSFT